MIYKILCGKGDAPFDYDVEAAELKFNELKDAGYLPLRSDKGNLPMRVFDREAKEIVWVPKIIGG